MNSRKLRLGELLLRHCERLCIRAGAFGAPVDAAYGVPLWDSGAFL